VFIEFADIIFAFDSIPAVIAITKDPFIIITSNIFAIIGLRALYFALAGFAELFAYLKYGIAIILLYVGVKMLIADYFHISGLVSLIIICSCLIISVILSVYLNNHIIKQDTVKKIKIV
jgi:tellurite resistance protein TerC